MSCGISREVCTVKGDKGIHIAVHRQTRFLDYMMLALLIYGHYPCLAGDRAEKLAGRGVLGV